MRAIVTFCLVFFLPLTSYAALTTGTNLAGDIIGNLPEGSMPMPFGAGGTVDPSYLAPIDASKAAGLGVSGATGGLTHPACIAETQARAARKQPPPNGDFPCVVPTSNASGIVDGVCFVNVCKGVASTGLGGILSALGGLPTLTSIAGLILGKLLQSGQNAPPSGAPSLATTTTPPLTSSYTSQFTNAGPYQPIDMSKLFSDSAIIVSNLLTALNPPAMQSR